MWMSVLSFDPLELDGWAFCSKRGGMKKGNVCGWALDDRRLQGTFEKPDGYGELSRLPRSKNTCGISSPLSAQDEKHRPIACLV